MRTLNIKVHQGKTEDLVLHVSQQLFFDYRRTTNGTTILAGEEYRFRTDSNQFSLIIIIEQQGYLEIDIVGGGGGTGILGWSWGSESAFVTKTSSIIREFCELHSFTYEEVERGGI